MTTIKSLKILMLQFGLYKSKGALEKVRSGQIIIEDLTTVQLEELIEKWEKYIEGAQFFGQFLETDPEQI